MQGPNPPQHKRSVSSVSGKRRHHHDYGGHQKPVPPPRSVPTTFRKPRRVDVGDRVFVTSSSKVYFEFADCNLNDSSHASDRCGENCDKLDKADFDKRGEEIRSTKDLPKIRNRIFEESLESQEISFYIGKTQMYH